MKIAFTTNILLCLCLFSCSSRDTKHENRSNERVSSAQAANPNDSSSPKSQGDWALIHSKEASIPLDEITTNTGMYMHYVPATKWVCVTGMTDAVRLFIYDWETKQLLHNLKFDLEGPNGIGGLTEALVVNADTIFVKGARPNSIYLTDISKKIKNEYKLKDKPTAFQSLANIFYHKHSIMGFLYPVVNYKYNVMDLSNRNLFKIDLRTKNFSILPVEYPNLLKSPSNAWSNEQFTPEIAANRSQLVLSYPALDSLYLYDMNSKYQGVTKYARSIYKTYEAKPYKVADIREIYKIYASTCYYFYLKYDPYRKVYYRFVLHPFEVGKKQLNQFEVVYARPFSIQILNEKLEVIGETLFEKDKYYIYDHFVNEEGLWISTCHPNNPQTDENTLRFELFSLVKNEK
jgi:hypothetical protein